MDEDRKHPEHSLLTYESTKVRITQHVASRERETQITSAID
jgi:hypothetical protein